MGWFTSESRDPTPFESVRASVKAVLATFISERVSRGTEYQTEEYSSFFQNGFKHLVLGHLASEISLEAIMESPVGFESFLSTIGTSSYRNLQRVFCAFQQMLIYDQCLDDLEYKRGWYFLVAEGACDIYSQPFSIAERHHRCYMDKLQSHPDADATALATRSFNCGLHLCCEDIVCEKPAAIVNPVLWSTLFSTFQELSASYEHFEEAEWLLKNKF